MLEGKVSLVTGSTGGIGLAIARAMAAAGAAIVFSGFGNREDVAETIVRIAAAHHVPVRFSPADPSQVSSIADTIAMTLDTFGRLDVLVNGAGIFHAAPLSEVTATAWNAMLARCLSSAFHATRLALPAMRRNGFGRIINVAPAISPAGAASAMARQALVGLTHATALEITDADITCNAICPGNSTADIGPLPVFLASDAATSINGTALPLDGGQIAH